MLCRVVCEFTESLYQQYVIDNVKNQILIVLLWRKEYDGEEVLISYEKVAKSYCSSLYVYSKMLII